MSGDLPQATVLSTTRRTVDLLNADFQIIPGQLSSKTLEVTVGDCITFSMENGQAFVRSVLEPRNTIARTYGNEIRRVAANVDHLFIGAAVTPLFNVAFIDRLLAVATLEEIPISLVVNKIDLGLEHTERLISIYRDLGVDLLLTSAFTGDGIEVLRERLADPALSLVLLAGISGVGKSSIVNTLIPGATIKVGDTSDRTGQGKQTTAQAMGHLYPRSGATPLIIVDIPGIQKFGVGYLPREHVARGFTEIHEFGSGCEYSSCSHTREDSCAVKAAVNAGKIAESRYGSYLEILAEIEEAKRY